VIIIILKIQIVTIFNVYIEFVERENCIHKMYCLEFIESRGGVLIQKNVEGHTFYFGLSNFQQSFYLVFITFANHATYLCFSNYASLLIPQKL